MAPPSLVSMAQRAAIRDVASIFDVGDMAYELVRPILKKIENPQQLHEIETRSPHIADWDSELWKAFIARDIPQWQEKIMEPRDPRSWHKVYAKLMRREKRAREEQEEQLLAAMSGESKKKEANSVTVVHKVLHEPTKHRPLFADGVPNPYVNKSGKVKHPVLKNAKSGRDMLYAIRKQTTMAERAKGLKWGQGRILPPPPSVKTQIKHAPASMLQQRQAPQLTEAAKKVISERATSSASPIAMGGRSAADKTINDAVRKEREEKEQRLRALASGKPFPPSSSTPKPTLPSSPTNPQARFDSSSSRPVVKPVLAPRLTSTVKPAVTRPLTSSSAAASATTTSEQAAKPASRLSPERGAISPAISSTQFRSPSPRPALPPVIRKRPAASLFMPRKKRKV